MQKQELGTSRATYHELYVYALSHRDPAFITQHVVDAYMLQTATAASKPIGPIFALAGLYLHLEKGFTGRQVQLMHVQMGKKKRTWPAIALPETRGSMTAADVLAVPAGTERDQAIDDWCRSVWEAFGGSRQAIVDLLQEYGIP